MTFKVADVQHGNVKAHIVKTFQRKNVELIFVIPELDTLVRQVLPTAVINQYSDGAETVTLCGADGSVKAYKMDDPRHIYFTERVDLTLTRRAEWHRILRLRVRTSRRR